jgi:hypothetical protein
MFPSDLTSVEPHSQRLALLVVADVAMLRNSPDELPPSPPPAQSIVAFPLTVVSRNLFHPTRFPSLLSTPAPQFLMSHLSKGVGA